MRDLLRKLQALGLKIDQAANVDPPPTAFTPVNKIIKGEWVESREGRIFVVRKTIPYGHQHGAISIERTEDYRRLSGFWQINEFSSLGLHEFIFLDTETTSLNIGAGAFIFLYGCCHFGEHGLEALQVFIEDPSHETAFLTFIDHYLSHFKCLISYNGKSFDLPVLRSRFVINKIPQQLNSCLHIDLLHTARRIWKYDMESRKLGDIEKSVLNFSRGEEEIPGWLVPQIYQDYLRTGNAEPLSGVFYHNEIDVVSLAALFLKINQMLTTHDLCGREGLSLSAIYQKARLYDLSDGLLRQALESEPDDFYREIILNNLAFSLKRQKKWDEAANIWDELANQGSPLACVELAKYFEHKLKNYTIALAWVEKALLLAEKNSKKSAESTANLEWRRKRLLRKMKKNAEA